MARDHPRARQRGHPGCARARWPAGGVVSAGCPAACGDLRAIGRTCARHFVRDARVGRWRRRALDERRGVLHLPVLSSAEHHLPLRPRERRADRLGAGRGANRRRPVPGDPNVVRFKGWHPGADVRHPSRRCRARRHQPDAADRLWRVQPEPDTGVLVAGGGVAGERRRVRRGQHAGWRRVRRGVASRRDARAQAACFRRLHRGRRAPDRRRLYEPGASRDPRRQQRRTPRGGCLEPAPGSVRGRRLHLPAARHGALPPVSGGGLLGA